MSQEQTKQANKQPAAEAAMLIRKPVAEVFEAFVNPDITAQFWFSRGIGRLDSGKQVQWFWDQYGFSTKVTAHQIVKDDLIAFSWMSPDVPVKVEISCKPYGNNFTFVRVIEKGWDPMRNDLIEIIVGQTEGWTLVLASLKAWLEQNVKLNVISDRHPDLIKPEAIV